MKAETYIHACAYVLYCTRIVKYRSKILKEHCGFSTASRNVVRNACNHINTGCPTGRRNTFFYFFFAPTLVSISLGQGLFGSLEINTCYTEKIKKVTCNI